MCAARYHGGPSILRQCRAVGSGDEVKVMVDLYGIHLTVHRSGSSATAIICVDMQVQHRSLRMASRATVKADERRQECMH